MSVKTTRQALQQLKDNLIHIRTVTMKCILAVDQRNGIGKNDRLPWHIPKDLVRFRALTESATLVMGSKTFFSLPMNKRPLPGKNRTSIVLSFDPGASKFAPYRRMSDRLHVMNLQTFFETFSKEDRSEMFLIGGSEIFSLFRHEIVELHLSRIKADYQCDKLVNIPMGSWRLVHQEEEHDHTYSLLRKPGPPLNQTLN
jgi:dihydrofolate reductase